jgi:hypothetical protein
VIGTAPDPFIARDMIVSLKHIFDSCMAKTGVFGM